MFRPLSLCLGLRYTRAKHQRHFISFVALISMIGIALGVMVLIAALSVMNGFDHEIHARFFVLTPEVSVVSRGQLPAKWQAQYQAIKQQQDVRTVAPFVSGRGALIESEVIQGVEMIGILPAYQARHSGIAQQIVAGDLNQLVPGQYQVIIGQALADQLGVGVGDSIRLFTTQAVDTLLGAFPRYRRFTIGAIFHAPAGFGFDNTRVYVHLTDASHFFMPNQLVSGFHLQLTSPYQAARVSQRLDRLIQPGQYVTNWTQQYSAFFEALAMEKTVLCVILFFIIAVAVFNLLSSLMMLVNEKKGDIAILRTMGATPGFILRVIIIQGSLIGACGTGLGVLCGLLLSYYITAIASAIEQLFHIQFVRASVFFVDFLPSQIHWQDVCWVAGGTLLLSVLATLYPAWQAFNIQPAKALRYE